MQVKLNSEGDGFSATFNNGWVLSAQWKSGTYSGVKTVEIAAWDRDDTVWWDFEAGRPASQGTSVLGWVTSEKLGEYMGDIASIIEAPCPECGSSTFVSRENRSLRPRTASVRAHYASHAADR